MSAPIPPASVPAAAEAGTRAEKLRIHTHTYTYHCPCTNLVLATPYQLSKLPRRCRRAQPQRESSTSTLTSALPGTVTEIAELEEGLEEGLGLVPEYVLPMGRLLGLGLQEGTGTGGREGTREGKGITTGSGSAEGYGYGYSLLLNTTQDRRPRILRLEDGFEKRWLRRCARCRGVVGYELSGGMGVEGEGGGEKETGAGGGGKEGAGGQVEGGRERCVYLFGGLVETAEL